ncbi:hypothetical protein [Gelidibacter salicanalis]|uniref:Uncharacterized protein n=1 Tax=Gelidibacter salicanalis TaxID=291193 RepID=A0A934NJV6_9FLAO|nr:hypothetical protein [Gelidibacter salicanalis]MBJ7882014.1 hypothetical protein [Gelidibacter salicanalis]
MAKPAWQCLDTLYWHGLMPYRKKDTSTLEFQRQLYHSRYDTLWYLTLRIGGAIAKRADF